MKKTNVPIDPDCIVRKIYGPNSPEANLLRNYRDQKLQESTVGRLIISLYYSIPVKFLTKQLPQNPTKYTLDHLIEYIS